MRGRGRHEVDDDVELLDVDPMSRRSDNHSDVATNSRMGAVIALVLAVGAVALVVGVGNSPGPPAEVPEPASDGDAAETEEPLTERELREAEFGVAIGDGPGLVWQRVEMETDARYWLWNNSSFTSDNGTTQWIIEADTSSPEVIERPSLLVDNPGYGLGRFTGGSLLVPNGPAPDHLIVVPNDGNAVRLDIPPSAEPSPSGLTTARFWFHGTVIGDRVVINRTRFAELAVAELGTRVGRDLTGVEHIDFQGDQIDLYTSSTGPVPEPIMLADVDLSDAEIDELRSVNRSSDDTFSADLATGAVQSVGFTDREYNNDLLIGLDGELMLGWTDRGGLGWLSTTVDGLTWSAERVGRVRWLFDSSTQLFSLGRESSISRSIDGGETWDHTPLPLRETQRAVAGDVVVLGQPWDDQKISGVSVETGSDRFWLDVFNDGQRFVLYGQSPFADPLLSGWIDNPASGAEWDSATNELVFTDPTSEEELLRVSGHAVESAVALDSPLEQMALARWPFGIAQPEWLVSSPVDVFGEGSLRVEFVAGDQYLLAIVTTVDGYELYLTDTTERP